MGTKNNQNEEANKSNIISRETETIQPPKTETIKENEISLSKGEVMVAEVDENGNEVNLFKTSEKTFNKFYDNNPKFKLKKK